MEITLDGYYTTEVNISIQKIAQSQKNIPKTICPVIPECAMHSYLLFEKNFFPAKVFDYDPNNSHLSGIFDFSSLDVNFLRNLAN